MRAFEFIKSKLINESKLKTDVPNEEWLASKIEYSKKKGRDRFGAPFMNATTGYLQGGQTINVPVSILKTLPGMRNEQQNVRKPDLEAILKIMKETGKLPMTNSGEEYVPFINVAWNGEAWVNEGNHRIMAADLLGWKELPIEIVYFDGGERIEDGPLYPSKIGLGNVKHGEVDEMALKQYKPIGDFTKPGPFSKVDKKLVTHPKNELKSVKFFEKTPYDFRLFFSNIPGTGKYNETGEMSVEQIRNIFGKYANDIITDHEDAITIVYVGNKGDAKVMLTPWIMAHRFGHAIQANNIGRNTESAWQYAEKHFFDNINSKLNEYYNKQSKQYSISNLKWDMTPEYNALFNAIGTQRSSRSGEIKRPYEFLYEIFAQYLGSGTIKFNAFPINLGYGRKAWGNPTKYLNIKSEFRDESERKHAADQLAYDMKLMFSDVLSSSVGKIYVM